MNIMDLFFKSFKSARDRVEIPVMPVDAAGVEKFTAANPGLVTLYGSVAEVASVQDTNLATVAETYLKAAGASQIEVYVESGYIRVRTDGEVCTSITGEPIAAGFGSAWCVDSISIFYVQESIVTVVSR